MLWLRLSKYNDSYEDFVHKLCPFAKAPTNVATVRAATAGCGWAKGAGSINLCTAGLLCCKSNESFMEQRQVVSMSLMRYEGLAARWWAFTQMGIGPGHLAGVDGLSFVKLMGSGGRNGFGIRPNWGVYALLGVWDTTEKAQAFFSTHSWWQAVDGHTREHCTFFLQTTTAHGCWDGRMPFDKTTNFDPTQPVAVITRATIYPSQMARFWRYSRTVSASLEDHPAARLSIGVGEWPLIQQATFSLWNSGEDMLRYAYKSRQHREVVQKTRELGWYKEELFARFVPTAVVGSWEGIEGLPLRL